MKLHRYNNFKLNEEWTPPLDRTIGQRKGEIEILEIIRDAANEAIEARMKFMETERKGTQVWGDEAFAQKYTELVNRIKLKADELVDGADIRESVEFPSIKKGDKVPVTHMLFKGTPTYEVVAEKDEFPSAQDGERVFPFKQGGDMMMLARLIDGKWVCK